jgi:hypothetical protein
MFASNCSHLIAIVRPFFGASEKAQAFSRKLPITPSRLTKRRLRDYTEVFSGAQREVANGRSGGGRANFFVCILKKKS